MKFNLNTIKSDLQNILRTIKFVFESDRRLCYVRLVLIVVQSILPLLSLILLKKLVDDITKTGVHHEGDLANIYFTIGLVCGVLLFTQISTVINNIVGEILGQKIIDYISSMLHKKSLELDLTYYDNPEYHDTFHRAQQEAAYRPIQILNSISDLIRNSISFIGVAIILADLSIFILLIMLLAGVPSLLIKLAKSKNYYNWNKENTSLYRMINYLSMLMTHRIYAKEIRIFNLGKYIQDKHNTIRKKLIDQITSLLSSQAKGDLVSSIFEVGALAVSIILLTNKFYTGSVTIGAFVMFFAAVRNANSFLNGILSNVTSIYRNKLFLNNLFEFIALQPLIKQADNAYILPKLKEGIRLENVSFHYEGSTKKVLDDISLKIKPGETILITGKNGAGKTTLINVLCRMYEASSGTISFDGINIKNIDIDSLHRNIGIIYQDYCKYDLTVTDNIRFGDIDGQHDITQVAEMSGANVFVNDFSKRYETLVGKYFKDGEELSTGQWQKIALARAFYGDSQIVILDEPTSSIDLETENNFFNQLNDQVKDKIVIIIGHKITGKIKADSYYHLQKGKLSKVSHQYVNANA